MNKIIIFIIISIIAFALYFTFFQKEEVEVLKEESPGLNVPFSGVKINDALCAPFLALPDCSYFPEDKQDQCLKCREK